MAKSDALLAKLLVNDTGWYSDILPYYSRLSSTVIELFVTPLHMSFQNMKNTLNSIESSLSEKQQIKSQNLSQKILPVV